MSLTQKIRAEIIYKCYQNWIPMGKNVLDVGCGNAVVGTQLKKKLNIEIFGTDIIDYRIVNFPFKQMERLNELPFENSSFDYIMFNDVLHHTLDIESLLLEGVRVAENIVVFEDCKNWFLDSLDRGLNYLYCSEMPCPLNFKTEQEWELLFDRLGFRYGKGKLTYPIWYPIRHMAFKLKKN